MGYPTLAVDDLTRSGFGEHFGVSGDTLRSFDSGRRFSAGDVVIRAYHRFEGISDPDDMSIVYAIEGRGGVRGTLVDAFGVYSDPTVSAFLARVPIRGAGRFGGAAAGRRGPLDDLPGEMHERSTIREPARFRSYPHGFPVPAVADPWHDEGGESGPAQ